MDGFDWQLEQELARILDPIVSTAAPPRSRGWKDGRRGRLRIFEGGLPDDGLASLEVPAPIPVVSPVAIIVNTILP